MKSTALLPVTFFVALVLSLIPAHAAESAATFKVSTLTFARPAEWQQVENISPMRKAQLKIPNKEGKAPGEIVFFHFGEGSGGGTKANVDRWFGQFEEGRDKIEAKSDETVVGKHKVTYVQAQGTYQSGMPGGQKTPQPGTMLLGAIIEDDAGSVFVKLTAPIELAKAAQPAFRKMVESALK